MKDLRLAGTEEDVLKCWIDDYGYYVLEIVEDGGDPTNITLDQDRVDLLHAWFFRAEKEREE